MLWKLLKQNVLFPNGLNWAQHLVTACLQGGGGPQVGEVTGLGGVTCLSI